MSVILLPGYAPLFKFQILNLVKMPEFACQVSAEDIINNEHVYSKVVKKIVKVPRWDGVPEEVRSQAVAAKIPVVVAPSESDSSSSSSGSESDGDDEEPPTKEFGCQVGQAFSREKGVRVVGEDAHTIRQAIDDGDTVIILPRHHKSFLRAPLIVPDNVVIEGLGDQEAQISLSPSSGIVLKHKSQLRNVHLLGKQNVIGNTHAVCVNLDGLESSMEYCTVSHGVVGCSVTSASAKVSSCTIHGQRATGINIPNLASPISIDHNYIADCNLSGMTLHGALGQIATRIGKSIVKNCRVGVAMSIQLSKGDGPIHHDLLESVQFDESYDSPNHDSNHSKVEATLILPWGIAWSTEKSWPPPAQVQKIKRGKKKGRIYVLRIGGGRCVLAEDGADEQQYDESFEETPPKSSASASSDPPGGNSNSGSKKKKRNCIN